MEVVRVLKSATLDRCGFTGESDCPQPSGNTTGERISAPARLVHDDDLRDAGQVDCLQLPRHVRAGNAESRESVVPKSPGVALAFDQNDVADAAGLVESVESIRDRLSLPEHPQRA